MKTTLTIQFKNSDHYSRFYKFAQERITFYHLCYREEPIMDIYQYERDHLLMEIKPDRISWNRENKLSPSMTISLPDSIVNELHNKWVMMELRKGLNSFFMIPPITFRLLKNTANEYEASIFNKKYLGYEFFKSKEYHDILMNKKQKEAERKAEIEAFSDEEDSYYDSAKTSMDQSQPEKVESNIDRIVRGDALPYKCVIS